MKLYGYWRSTSSYRVRIALNMKGVRYDQSPVHLVRDGGEQNAPAFRAINPAGRVPALELDDGRVITQSIAIMAYLEATHPNPPLIPSDPYEAAIARSLAFAIASDMQPLHNKAVMDYITGKFGRSIDDFKAWTAHWTHSVFTAIEQRCQSPFVMGDRFTIVDACLTPACYAARRFGVDLSGYPKIEAADEAARVLPPVAQAAPERQPDAPADAEPR